MSEDAVELRHIKIVGVGLVVGGARFAPQALQVASGVLLRVVEPAWDWSGRVKHLNIGLVWDDHDHHSPTVGGPPRRGVVQVLIGFDVNRIRHTKVELLGPWFVASALKCCILVGELHNLPTDRLREELARWPTYPPLNPEQL